MLRAAFGNLQWETDKQSWQKYGTHLDQNMKLLILYLAKGIEFI